MIHDCLILGWIERRSETVFEWPDEFRIARCSYQRLCNCGWNSDSCIHWVWGKFFLWRNISLVYFRNYIGILTVLSIFLINSKLVMHNKKQLWQVPAEHVISASFMSAPAALAVAKIAFPETKSTDFKISKEMELEVGYGGFLWHMLIKCILLAK